MSECTQTEAAEDATVDDRTLYINDFAEQIVEREQSRDPLASYVRREFVELCRHVVARRLKEAGEFVSGFALRV